MRTLTYVKYVNPNLLLACNTLMNTMYEYDVRTRRIVFLTLLAWSI